MTLDQCISKSYIFVQFFWSHKHDFKGSAVFFFFVELCIGLIKVLSDLLVHYFPFVIIC